MHIVVTGGSSGIGFAVARLYAARGDSVSLIARDATRLEQARKSLSSAAARIHVASADTGSAAEITSAIAACEVEFGPCDILVACAGTVEPGSFETQAPDIFDAQVITNALGTVNSVRAVYSGMKARSRGRVMIVSSGAALIGIPGYTAYCTSKSALTGFAEALDAEARASGVRILICFPADTLTPQLEKELVRRPPEARILMGDAPAWAVDDVARRIVEAIDRGNSKTYFGLSITAVGLIGPLVKPLVIAWYRWRLGRLR